MKNKGFTMVELLVVLLIVGVLAAVATPMYLASTKRAKASEAIATLSLMRQAERDYYASHNSFTADITDINAPLPTGLDIKVGVAKYFSSPSYSVDVGGAFANTTVGGTAADFVVKADGSSSTVADVTNSTGARDYTDVATYRLEMDNSGRIMVSYDGGTTWGLW